MNQVLRKFSQYNDPKWDQITLFPKAYRYTSAGVVHLRLVYMGSISLKVVHGLGVSGLSIIFNKFLATVQ